jgi:hypothetical protein
MPLEFPRLSLTPPSSGTRPTPALCAIHARAGVLLSAPRERASKSLSRPESESTSPSILAISIPIPIATPMNRPTLSESKVIGDMYEWHLDKQYLSSFVVSFVASFIDYKTLPSKTFDKARDKAHDKDEC